MAQKNPLIDAFAGKVDELLDRNDLESFWNCEKPFKEFLQSDIVSQVINTELKNIAADPSYLGDWRPKQLMVHRGTGYLLSISTFDEPRRYIHTTPFYGMYTPLGKKPLPFNRYRLPDKYRNDVFDPGIRLGQPEFCSVAPGEILSLQSRDYAYDFTVTEPILVLKFTTASFDTLEWLFSKETLSPWQANDAELAATQLRVASYVLGRLAHQYSLETLETLSGHRHHAVRWAAIQSLGRLSRTAAIAKLERTLSDPHPHLRRAAEKTLRQLTGKVPG